MDFVKFDMHCHTNEGSPDSKVLIREYIDILMKKGFGGMLITDHNSHDGYDNLTDYELCMLNEFSVIKGIEYDTSDYGHMIIVMPKGTVPNVLKYRGMKLKDAIRIVHSNGGIIGPAHPCGEPFLSFYTTAFSPRKQICKRKFLKEFDFLEGYNACEPQELNLYARLLAHKYNLPMLGGSDSHWHDCVGLGYTMLPDYIKSEDDLIAYIKEKPNIKIGGRRYGRTTKDKLGFFNHFLVYGFYYYNKFETIINSFGRTKHLKNEEVKDEKHRL